MPKRDRFPMSSEEAQNLAESMEDPKELPEWDSMNTETQTPTTTVDANVDHDHAGESLVKGSKKKQQQQQDNDDIYSDIDKEELDPQDEHDEFLDVPLSELRGTRFQQTTAAALRQLKKLYVRLYGDQLPPSEMLRTLCLAMTLFFMIGGYWLLRSLKDPILTALCGVSVIPKAKMLSVFVVLGVVSIYNKLLDSDIPKHQLFYIFGSFYAGLFTVIALLLMDETIGLPNEQPDPKRILGWISYCSIESFGSVMVSLFWSFANSNFSLETAKASYGVMVATAQVGSIIGPTIVNQYAAKMGVAKCYLIGAFCMVLLQLSMYTYIHVYGVQDEQMDADKTHDAPKGKKPKAGILEGLHLFWEHNYVKGIFAISALFMVEVTIVDYTMKVLAQEYFSKLHPCQAGMSCYNAATGVHGMSEDATASFTTFMGLFGQATNTLSFFLSFLGTSAVIRYLGLRLSLLLFPTLCLAVIIFVRLRPTLYVVFTAMMMLKACSYSLNNPTKEILYQPTSSAVKYKAKSWIDIFGARGSKALGSVVTNAFSDSAEHLVSNGSLVGMAVASFLIWNARYMGNKFDEYTESGYIVGGDDEAGKELEAVSMSPNDQNEQQDTSCALYHDDKEVGREEEGQSDGQGVEESKEPDSSEDEKPEVAMV